MLYHASRTPGLKELVPLVSTHGKAWVYAVTNPVTALAFGAPKDDFDVLMDETNGVPALWECRPGALREIYGGKACSLYTVPEEGFLSGMTGWEPERVCPLAVPVLHEETVPDLYQRLLRAADDGACTVHFFREDSVYRQFLCREWRARIAAFGMTADDVRADARLAPYAQVLLTTPPGACADTPDWAAPEVTVAQMQALERAANAAGLSFRQMMENAGTAAARLLQERLPGMKTAAVFCGRGNNGGDGLVLARRLQQAGAAVTVIYVQGAPHTAEAAANAAALEGLGVAMRTLEVLTEEEVLAVIEMDAAVDAVCGTGFHGALSPAARRAAELMARCRFVMALDVPSGVAADTGEAAESAVEADVTVAFHAAKACHRLAPAHCGETLVADIGIRLP